MTKHEFTAQLESFAQFTEQLEAAARRYADLTGERRIGELDAESLYPGTDTIVWHWEDWAMSCLRDSGSFHMPAEFLWNEQEITAQIHARQAAARQAADQRRRAQADAADQQERELYTRLKAKYEPQETHPDA